MMKNVIISKLCIRGVTILRKSIVTRKVHKTVNKRVLVTGASAGIGAATALLLAKLDAQLALVGRNEDKLRRVAADCQAQRGHTPLVILADLATDEGVQHTAEETLKHFDNKLDVLVNNAGIGARATIQDTDMETFDRVFNLNVRGVYDLTRRLVPAIIAVKGNIVNVSSIVGTMTRVGSLPYPMSKAALDHFTRLVALELAPKGVRVNAVSPGITVSEFVRRLVDLSDEQYAAWLRDAEENIPMGRAAEGIHIARAIAYLASDAADLITGAILPVDGGLQLAGFGTNKLTIEKKN